MSKSEVPDQQLVSEKFDTFIFLFWGRGGRIPEGQGLLD
jgi:hypothetical protein